MHITNKLNMSRTKKTNVKFSCELFNFRFTQISEKEDNILSKLGNLFIILLKIILLLLKVFGAFSLIDINIF